MAAHDSKLENVLLNKEGRVKIADFGIAKLVGKQATRAATRTGEEESATADAVDSIQPIDGSLTGAGQVIGTPQYMAPEQIEHPAQVDHRADIYSLGVVFYQMLTGELPVGRFAPPSRKVQIDVRLDEIVLRALEKEPDRRYQHASEVKTQVDLIGSTPRTATARPQQLADFVEMFLGSPFTSPLARTCANAAALGFLGFLASLRFIPLPGMLGFSGFAGFFGCFGLIGVAVIIELVMRRKAKPQPEATDGSPGRPLGTGPATASARSGTDTARTLSRHAVWGAAWAAFAVSFVLLNVLRGHPPRNIDGLQHLLWAFSLASPLGTTILGAKALRDIRHSGGKLRGLGLALFDVLFFPLLALNALMFWNATWTVPSSVGPADEFLHVVLPIAAIVLALLIDIPIVLWVWRAAKRAPGGTGKSTADASAAGRQSAHGTRAGWLLDQPLHGYTATTPLEKTLATIAFLLSFATIGVVGYVDNYSHMTAVQISGWVLLGESVALILGIISRKSRVGKAAVVISAALVLFVLGSLPRK